MVTRKSPNAEVKSVILQSWDAYLADAVRQPLELPTPEGTLTFRYPSGQVGAEMQQLISTGVPYIDLCAAMLSDDDAKILRSLYQDAPQDVCEALFNDVSNAFERSTGK